MKRYGWKLLAIAFVFLFSAFVIQPSNIEASQITGDFIGGLQENSIVTDAVHESDAKETFTYLPADEGNEEGARFTTCVNGITMMVHNFTSYKASLTGWHNWVLCAPMAFPPQLNLSSHLETDKTKLQNEPPVRELTMFYTNQNIDDAQGLTWVLNDGNSTKIQLNFEKAQGNKGNQDMMFSVLKLGLNALETFLSQNPIKIAKFAVDTTQSCITEGGASTANGTFYARTYMKSAGYTNSIPQLSDSNTYFAVTDDFRYYGMAVTAHFSNRPDQLMVYFYDRYGYISHMLGKIAAEHMKSAGDSAIGFPQSGDKAVVSDPTGDFEPSLGSLNSGTFQFAGDAGWAVQQAVAQAAGSKDVWKRLSDYIKTDDFKKQITAMSSDNMYKLHNRIWKTEVSDEDAEYILLTISKLKVSAEQGGKDDMMILNQSGLL